MFLDIVGNLIMIVILIIILVVLLGVIIVFLPEILENILNAKEAWDNFKEVLKDEEDDK